MQYTATRIAIIVAALIVLVASSICGQRVPLPPGVFYYKPAASVFGAEAAWVNPAGLGRYNASSFQVMADYADGYCFKSWGTVIDREQIAVAYRHLNKPDSVNYSEYLFAAGMSLGRRLHFGGSYRYFKEAPGIYNKRHFWNIGFMGQGRSSFSWAAVFSNLNRGQVEGKRTEIEQRYSLSYRPMGKVVTFSVDMFLSTKTKLSNADYVYHLEVVPCRGLYVEGYVDSEKNFQIGARVNLIQHFIGSQSSFQKSGDHLRTTAFLGATSLKQPSLIPPPQRRLAVGLSGKLQENPPRPVFGSRETSFITLLTTIYRAAEDPSIGELVLSLKGISLGFGQAQELREALMYFKSAGKTIICHLSYPNNIGYFVASISDSILIPPVSQLNLVGLKAELTFYAGTLEKLGVKADVIRIGNYKTAPEKYTQNAATEQNKRQINRILDNIYNQFVTAIAEGRGVSIDSVQDIINNGPYTSAEAIEHGLVEGLSYRDELKKDFLSKLPEVSFRRYLSDTLLNDGWPAEPVLALVVAEGDITEGGGNVSPFDASNKVTPASMRHAFERAVGESNVKGVIFRINSPGGYALASDEIYHNAQEATEEKLMVASMSNVAASGGYYIAMPSTRLFANPGTITGSIGIYGGKVDLSGFYKKINLGKELYTRGQFAGMLSTIRPFSQEERERYRTHLKAFYDHFIQLVSGNRKLPVDSVDALSRGKVWTGREALSNGLIDELGGLKRSLDYVADRLELKDYRIAIYPEKRPWFVLPGRSFMKAIARFLVGEGTFNEVLSKGLGLTESGEIIARMPFDITIE